MTELLGGTVIVLLAAGSGLLAWRIGALQRRLDELPMALSQGFDERHRGMLADLHNGLTQQGDRLTAALTDNSDRLRASTGEELKQTRDTLHKLQLTLTETLGQNREAMLEKLALTTQALTGKIDEQLALIAGRVNERLDEGFKKTNETFTNVMTRLATIDEAQKKNRDAHRQRRRAAGNSRR